VSSVQSQRRKLQHEYLANRTDLVDISVMYNDWGQEYFEWREPWYVCKDMAEQQRLDTQGLQRCQDDVSSMHFGVDGQVVRLMLQLVQVRIIIVAASR
jgi:hypothetical protein